MRAFLLAALLLAPGLAHAASWDTYFRLGSIWVTDPAFDVVSEGDTMLQLQVGAGYLPGADDRLVLELGYAYASTSAPLFQDLEGSLGLHSFQGSGLYRLPTGRYGNVLFRGTAAVELATLEIKSPTFSDVSTLLALEATAGYEVQVPLGAESHLGFSAEAGYGLRPFAADFSDLSPDEPSGGIENAPVSVGTLDLSGAILRFGASLRF